MTKEELKQALKELIKDGDFSVKIEEIEGGGSSFEIRVTMNIDDEQMSSSSIYLPSY